jgi:single-stranded-DNA-specific exonuclease
MNWKILNQEPIKNTQHLIDVLLQNRQIQHPKKFLRPPSLDQIRPTDVNIDPAQLKKAAKRLQQAIENQEKVVIYGDYDADGIIAASIVWLTLNHLDLTAIPFIPNREKHGYGLAVNALAEIQQEHDPDLILTVDNGIVAFEALEWAKKQNLEVIVTDHHQPKKTLPPVSALVHSTEICGAGVAWFLMRQLAPDYALSLIDLLAIATITDQMPLAGINRAFAKQGFRAIAETKRPGLKTLMQVAEIDPSKISSYTVGFMLGPRINAAGRIAQGIEAMRLLCTSNDQAAKKIARKLDKINHTRQELTQEHLELGLSQAGDFKNHKLIFVSSTEFHEGVIGLLAGKLTEKFYKPSIVVAESAKVAKASARSVKGVDITKLIRQAEDLLINAGGHELAAGFSAAPENLDKLKQKLFTLADEQIAKDLLVPELKIDTLLPPDLVNLETAKTLLDLGPYGMANPWPVFALNNVMIVDIKTMGRDNSHLKLGLRLKGKDYSVMTAVGWNMGKLSQTLSSGDELNIAFNLDINRWRSKESLQLRLKDIKK